ncbi:MAG TPA: maleylpyruvate isomerase family mycothiol-dependent enzyme [Mycobacteriales bacterium]
MAEYGEWLSAIRHSHERMSSLVGGLTAEQATLRSYAADWTVAQVASHLGSQAEIFDLFLTAGLEGAEAPDADVITPIWDRWNGLPPAAQLAGSVVANGRLLARLEGLTPEQQDSFALSLFGTDVDIAGLAGLRLGEHVLHTWDMAVALDPAATLADDAVALLIDTLPSRAAQAGTPVPGAAPVAVAVTDPDRAFDLTLNPVVTLTPRAGGTADATFPAEAFIRLVAGRLDPDHTPLGVDAGDRLDQLRQAFPGF